MRRLLAVLVFAGLVQAPAAAGWSWPVDGPVIRPFVLGDDPYAAGQHRGIDIGGSPGTPVRAATGGSVSFVGSVPAGGRAVTVRTADGLSVTYTELGATRVERGVDVAEGDPIGTIGPASHVHLGVRVTADRQGYLDPLRFLPARITGTARADPVPEPAVTVEEPEPAAEAVERAEPAAPATATETTSKLQPEPKPVPEPEPEPVVPASRPPVASAAPAPAQAAEPTGVPVTADTPLMAAAVGRSVEPSRERPRASDGRSEPPQAGATRPSLVRDTSAPNPGRLSRAASAASRRQGAVSRREEATRKRGRSVDAPLPTARVEPKAAEPRAGKARAIESQRQADRPALRSAAGSRIGPVLLATLLMLSLAVAPAWALSRRRRGVSAQAHSLGKCSIGRMRPPRLIHTCVRAAETGWPTMPARSRVRIALHRPVPRPRRSVPVDT